MINNLKEFIEARGLGETTFQDIERNTYKYTNCGAWIVHSRPAYSGRGTLTVGSIVEGAEDCTPIIIAYPFAIDDFWSALQKVEDEAEEIWKYTHGCDDCGIETDRGMAINPKCKTCKGEGVIV